MSVFPFFFFLLLTKKLMEISEGLKMKLFENFRDQNKTKKNFRDKNKILDKH